MPATLIPRPRTVEAAAGDLVVYVLADIVAAPSCDVPASIARHMPRLGSTAEFVTAAATALDNAGLLAGPVTA